MIMGVRNGCVTCVYKKGQDQRHAAVQNTEMSADNSWSDVLHVHDRRATDLGKRQAARAAIERRRTDAAVVIQKNARSRLARKKVGCYILRILLFY